METLNIAPSSSIKRSYSDEKMNRQNDKTQDAEKDTFRNSVAFFTLGILNNTAYVIMIAGAKQIDAGGVGLVFLCDVVPCFLVKLSSPFWFHKVPYAVRVIFASILMAGSFITVGLADTTELQLFGVALCSVQVGLGEASFLALTSHYANRASLAAWSSGTGVAGVFGFAWVVALNQWVGLSFQTTLLVALVLPFLWLFTYFFVLSKPVPKGMRVEQDFMEDAFALPTDDAFADDIDLLDGFERPKSRPLEPSQDRSLTFFKRLRFIVSLWPYIVPLIVVYFAEYSMQSGVWSAIGFPVTKKASRLQFYSYSNWTYQIGVLISRSSGLIYQADRKALWAMPMIQVILLFIFIWVAVSHIWYDYWLLVLCLVAGLLGGAVYVNTFTLIAKEVPDDMKEIALATSSMGESIGTIFSDIAGVFIQSCLYKFNDIDGAIVACSIDKFW